MGKLQPHETNDWWSLDHKRIPFDPMLVASSSVDEWGEHALSFLADMPRVRYEPLKDEYGLEGHSAEGDGEDAPCGSDGDREDDASA